jgi:hypothetical protein
MDNRGNSNYFMVTWCRDLVYTWRIHSYFIGDSHRCGFDKTNQRSKNPVKINNRNIILNY